MRFEIIYIIPNNYYLALKSLLFKTYQIKKIDFKMLALTNPKVQSIREEVFSMEDQNLTAESESLTDLKSTTTEINGASDDEDTSIGNSGIVGEGHLEDLSSGEVISKKKRRGRPRRKAAIDLEKPSSPSSQGSLSSSANSRNTSKRRLGRPPGSGRLQLLASLGTLGFNSRFRQSVFLFQCVTRRRRENRT